MKQQCILPRQVEHRGDMGVLPSLFAHPLIWALSPETISRPSRLRGSCHNSFVHALLRCLQQSVVPGIRPALTPVSSGQQLSTMSCDIRADPRKQVSDPFSREDRSAAPHRSILLPGKSCSPLCYTKYLLSNLTPQFSLLIKVNSFLLGFHLILASGSSTE